jgi:hypothetical protein
LALKSNGPLPWQAMRAIICERMGWTFAAYDDTDTLDIAELLTVWDAQAKA